MPNPFENRPLFENMKTCSGCGYEFDPKTKRSKKGFIHQCDECSESDTTVRAIGFNDGSLNKGTSIAVYAGKNEEVRKKLTKQRSRTGGF